MLVQENTFQNVVLQNVGRFKTVSMLLTRIKFVV